MSRRWRSMQELRHISKNTSISSETKPYLRSMIHAAQKIEKKALEHPDNVQDTLDEAQQLFYQISQSANSATGKLIGEILSGVKAESSVPYLKELQERQEQFQLKGPQDTGITGVSTHLKDLDNMLNGFNNSNLMILPPVLRWEKRLWR